MRNRQQLKVNFRHFRYDVHASQRLNKDHQPNCPIEKDKKKGVSFVCILQSRESIFTCLVVEEMHGLLLISSNRRGSEF